MIIFCVMLTSCSANNLQLHQKNNLNIVLLNSLYSGKYKNLKDIKLADGCISISSKKSDSSDTYCRNIIYSDTAKVDSSFTELKSYHSLIDNLDFEMLETRKYNSLGLLTSYDKSITDLFPATGSFFNIQLQKKIYNDEKEVENIIFNYNNSLRNVLIHTLRIYLFDLKNNFIFTPQSLIDYSKYKIRVENNVMHFDPDINIISNISDFNVSNFISDHKLSLSITKYHENDQWSISFVKDGVDYTISIDDNNGNTFLERSR